MQIKKQGDVIIIQVTEKDLDDPRTTCTVVENLIRTDGERKFVFDMSLLPAIYSMQIGTLVTIHVMCYENVAIMKLAGVNEKVKNVLRMVGLETLMEMHHGPDVAVQSFGKKP